MKILVILVFAVPIVALLQGCGWAENYSTRSSNIETTTASSAAVSLVESFFKAVEENRKGDAAAFFSGLEVPSANVKVDEIDTNRLIATQSAHIDWFSALREREFRFGRATLMESERETTSVRAFCTSPIGDLRIPQVIDFVIVEENGRLKIKNIILNNKATFEERKKTLTS